MLSLRQIADGLSDRFRLLTGGPHGALPRYQTLPASVDWSYELLSEPERVLFRRLAVFVGGCSLEAVEAGDHRGLGLGRAGEGDLRRLRGAEAVHSDRAAAKRQRMIVKR